MTAKINRHSRILYDRFLLKNNVKFDRVVKDLKFKVKKHNYKLLDFPEWKVKVLKKLGRKYKYKFKKHPKKRKFYRRIEGFFYHILKGLSATNFNDNFLRNNFRKTILDDYNNEADYYKLFFFKSGLKQFVKANRRLKYFRKKIIIRKMFAKKFGVSSNKKFYHIHKKFKNKSDTILRWINLVELRLQNVILSLGLARTLKYAKYMVSDGFIFLNGRRVGHNIYRTVVKPTDIICIPKKMHKLSKKRFFKKFFHPKYLYVDWYRNLDVFARFWTPNSYKDYCEKKKFYKIFWSNRTFEWKFIHNENALIFSNLKKNKTLLDTSNKKIAFSFYQKFSFYNFLSIYKMRSLAINKKLIDFFLHSYYF